MKKIIIFATLLILFIAGCQQKAVTEEDSLTVAQDYIEETYPSAVIVEEASKNLSCEGCYEFIYTLNSSDEDSLQSEETVAILTVVNGSVTNVETSSIDNEEFCGRSTNGTCSADDGCIAGGCSGQVCASKSEEPVMTTCEYTDCYDNEKYGLECGCVEGKCQWK